MFIKEGTKEIKKLRIKITDEVTAILTEIKKDKYKIQLYSKRKDKEKKNVTILLKGKEGIKIYSKNLEKEDIFANFNCERIDLEDTLENYFSDIIFNRKLRTRYKKALERKSLNKGSVVCVKGLNSGSSGITKYEVYILEGNRKIEYIRGLGPYWSEKNDCYHCHAWGTSRPLELIITIGYALGLSFDEIEQNYLIF